MTGSTETFAPWGLAALALREQNHTVQTVQKESSLKRKDLSLVDLNPLTHAPDLNNRQLVEALQIVSLDLIEKHKGIKPVQMESTMVSSAKNNGHVPRFVARFQVNELTEDQMHQLELLTRSMYKVSVRTRKDSDGKDIPTGSYPSKTEEELEKSKTGGWVMGPNTPPVDGANVGLYVFKDLGKVNKDTFFQNDIAESKYIVEIREDQMFQTDLVEFIARAGIILGNGTEVNHSDLLYEAYYKLMRLGLKDFDSQSIYGMGDILSAIRRGLLIPLASPDLSEGIDQRPESVLLAGVPGTGKTLVAQQLLHEETGLFILPIDATDLLKELYSEPQKQVIFPRIAEVAHTTGRRVVLHIDDIENAASDDDKTKSTLLNLMEGVSDFGFYVIASTNEPEKMVPSLLQPGRFGILLYTGLQDVQARYEILKIHSNAFSKRTGTPLFASEQEREVILQAVVEKTDKFTPRYLAEIAIVAKSYLTERVARKTGTNIGLTEENLEGYTFTVEDWEKALRDVSRRYNKRGTVNKDKQISEFVANSRVAAGFIADNDQQLVFSSQVHAKIAAIRNENTTD